MSSLIWVLFAGCSGTTPEPTFPHNDVTVTIVEGGVVTCEAPELRDEAPYSQVLSAGDWDAQAGYGDELARHAGGSLVVADLTGDGRLDIVLPSDGGTQLFVAQGDGSYADETAERFPHRRPDQGLGGVAADHDGDGDLDLFITGYGEASVLLQNDGDGYFSDVSSALDWDDTALHSIGGAWGDADGDGDLDLLVVVQADERLFLEHFMYVGTIPECPANALLLNDGTGKYTDASSRLSDTFLHGCTYAGGFFDMNADGRQDIYVSNDFGPHVEPNRVAWQSGSSFSEDSQRGLDVRAYSMGLGVGDINGDAYPDVFVPSWDQVHLLESVGGAEWYDTSLVSGLQFDAESTGHHVGWSGEVVDLDNDGKNELHAVFGDLYQTEEALEWIYMTNRFVTPTSQPDAVWTRDGDGIFQEVGEAWGLDADGVSRGVVWADLNDDGWLDLIRQDLMAPAEIHMAQCGSAGWLRVALSQPGPNPDAIGARITLTVDGVSRFADVRAGGTGFGSAGPPEVHFGLGTAATVERLEIAWPDGAKSTVKDLVGSQQVWITRDG